MEVHPLSSRGCWQIFSGTLGSNQVVIENRMKSIGIIFPPTPLSFMWSSGLDTTASQSRAFFRQAKTAEN